MKVRLSVELSVTGAKGEPIFEHRDTHTDHERAVERLPIGFQIPTTAPPDYPDEEDRAARLGSEFDALVRGSGSPRRAARQ